MNETIRGVRVGVGPALPPRKDYVYNGTEPYTPPAEQPSKGQPCSADGCAGPVHAKGLCNAHYRKNRNGGEPDGRYKPFDPSKCGTPHGYKHHKYHGVEVCQPCMDAKNKYERQTYARRMGAWK